MESHSNKMNVSVLWFVEWGLSRRAVQCGSVKVFNRLKDAKAFVLSLKSEYLWRILRSETERGTWLRYQKPPTLHSANYDDAQAHFDAEGKGLQSADN